MKKYPEETKQYYVSYDFDRVGAIGALIESLRFQFLIELPIFGDNLILGLFVETGIV